MCKVNFTKHFTKGNLKGLDYVGSLDFVSVKSALDWIKGVKANAKNGSLNYNLIRYSIEIIDPSL
jgi:hypothetical protein